MTFFLHDLRYAARLLRKSPTFTLTAVLCLGLAIGANTALFSILNAFLWKPLPVAEPGNLVRLFAQGPTDGFFYLNFSYPEFQEYGRQQDRLAAIAATTGVELAFRAETGEPIRVFGEAVSDNYFPMLGVDGRLGRRLAARADGSPNVTPEVVLSHRFWTRRLHADPAIVGKTIWLTGVPFTVVGVTPPAFKGTYPTIPFAPELWIPLGTLPRVQLGGTSIFQDRASRSLALLGRLAPGASLAQAQAAMDTVARRLAQDYPDTNKGVKALVFRELDTHPEVYTARGANLVAWLFLALGAVVLTVACANLANLALARAAGRRKEIALRLALGAGRGQLVRQLVTEAVLLSLLAGMFGLSVAVAATRAVSSISLPTDIPLAFDVAIDWRVLWFTLGISLAAGLAFGLAPALAASRPALVPALKGTETVRQGRRRRVTVASCLMAAQVAFSLVLLVAAGLFWKSVGGTGAVDPGMRLSNRALASFSPALLRYDTARGAAFYRALLERLEQAPEIRSAGLVGWVPLGFQASERRLVIQGVDVPEGRMRSLDTVVTPGYFETVGIAVRRGRAFTDQDTAASLPVAIVNETFARRAWPGQEPIGRQLRLDTDDARWLTVVGVLRDAKYRNLNETPRPYLLRPLSQAPDNDLTLVAWGKGGHAATLAAIGREVRALDPDMPMLDVKTMDRQLAKVRFLPQAMTALAGPTSLVATMIAAIGLYGVMACSVGRRSREFGIRLAIGARSGDIVAQVLSAGFRVVAVGSLLGIGMALAFGRLVRGLLVGVSGTDAVVFLGALGLLAAVALLAVYLPARRASRVDPLVALRQE